LWAEQSEDAARHALRQCLLDLRQALTKANIAAIRAEADLIGLEPSMVVVDAVRFERKVAEGTPEALEEAAVLYRGDLLEGFSIKEPAFEDWLRVERERLRFQAVGVMKKLLAHHVRQKATDSAIQITVRLLALEPLDEAVHRALMQLYSKSGRRSAALRQYEDCVDLLSRELQTEPEAETRELYRRLIAEQPRLGTQASPPTAERRRPMPQVGGIRALPRARSATPLVGRAAELAWLDGLRQKADTGQPQLAFVVGEAGIGKTRLFHEFASRIRDRQAHILLGRGREGEDVLPFAPWVEAIRPALSENVVARLAVVTRQDLARLFPEIAEGPAPTPSGLEDGPRIFEAVAHLLRQLASDHPLIVVIEDLHWCDDMTIRLLKFLPRRVEGKRVLLAGTARPEEVVDSGRGRLLEGLRHDEFCTSTTVRPLSQEEMTQLLRAVLSSRDPGAEAALADRVWSLSEGNPFVVIECARAASTREALAEGARLELPDQVRALTARCFTDLSECAARLGDVAAVIGRDFDVAVLKHAAGATEHQLAEGLEELVRRRVLREVAGRFDFGHDRVREVAYSRLLGPRRALLHRQVAQALEANYLSDLSTHFAAIGTHYRHASVWTEACQYLARAGFQAWERGAGREALACFEDALQAAARLPDTDSLRELRVHLSLAANGASQAIGSWERGRPHLLAVVQLAATLPDRRWEGLVAAALAQSYRAASTFDRALQLGDSALVIATETGDRGLESMARFGLAYIEISLGNFRRALDYVTPLLSDDIQSLGLEGPFLPSVDDVPGMRAFARYLIVFCCVELGEFDFGRRVAEESFRQVDTLDDQLGTSRIVANMALGKLLNARGDFDAAVRAFEAALAIYRDDCHRHLSRPLGWGLGLACALAGRVGEGLDRLERAEANEREIGSTAFRDMLLLHLGRAYIKARRLDDATRVSREALSFGIDHGDRLAIAGAHGLLGEVAMLRNPVDQEAMEHHVLEALALAEKLELRPLAARCHLRLAWLYAKIGRLDSGGHHEAAESLLNQMGRPLSLDAAAVH